MGARLGVTVRVSGSGCAWRVVGWRTGRMVLVECTTCRTSPRGDRPLLLVRQEDVVLEA